MAEYPARIRILQDTATNLTSNNPVLLSGEWGFETDTKKIKIGDGASAWNDLVYKFEVVFTSAEKTKLATVDQIFTAAEKTKLADIEEGATNGADLVDDTTPQLGGSLDMNENSISYDFDILAADHTWSGDIITATAGEGLVIGDVCYLKSDGKFWKMDADAAATTAGMCAMATATISTDASGVFLIRGLIRDDSWDGTVGAQLWAPTTPGNPTETQPSGSGDIARLMGYVPHADYIWFDPDKTYVEVS